MLGEEQNTGGWSPTYTYITTTPITYPTNYGWICPKCGHVYAPHVNECSKCNVEYNIYTTSGSVTIKGDEQFTETAKPTKKKNRKFIKK